MTKCNRCERHCEDCGQDTGKIDKLSFFAFGFLNPTGQDLHNPSDEECVWGKKEWGLRNPFK
jgi:hypothetical protein